MSFKYRTTIMQVSPLERDDICILSFPRKYLRQWWDI